MHGGIGMTAEYPVGHYVSRLTAIAHTLAALRIICGSSQPRSPITTWSTP